MCASPTMQSYYKLASLRFAARAAASRTASSVRTLATFAPDPTPSQFTSQETRDVADLDGLMSIVRELGPLPKYPNTLLTDNASLQAKRQDRTITIISHNAPQGHGPTRSGASMPPSRRASSLPRPHHRQSPWPHTKHLPRPQQLARRNPSRHARCMTHTRRSSYHSRRSPR